MPRRPSKHIDSPKEFGERLKRLRLAAGLSQRDLSFEGCTSAYVSRIEAGARTPSMQVIQEFAKRLNVNADWLATGQEANNPVSRIQRLAQEAAEWIPDGWLGVALEPIETELRELIAQRKAEAERRRQEIIDGMRETLKCGGVPEDQIEEVIRRATETLSATNSGQ